MNIFDPFKTNKRKSPDQNRSSVKNSKQRNVDNYWSNSRNLSILETKATILETKNTLETPKLKARLKKFIKGNKIVITVIGSYNNPNNSQNSSIQNVNFGDSFELKAKRGLNLKKKRHFHQKKDRIVSESLKNKLKFNYSEGNIQTNQSKTIDLTKNRLLIE